MRLLRILLCALAMAIGVGGCTTTSGVERATAAAQADAAYRRGDFRDALRGYLDWPGGDRDPEVQAKIGNCAALLGRPDQAERAYRRALELNPELPDVRYNLAVLDLKQAQAQLIAALPQSAETPMLRLHIRRLLDQMSVIDATHATAHSTARVGEDQP